MYQIEFSGMMLSNSAREAVVTMVVEVGGRGNPVARVHSMFFDCSNRNGAGRKKRRMSSSVNQSEGFVV